MLLHISLGPLLDIIDNELKNRMKEDPRGRRYSDALKRLAVTVHYTSATAYNILRFSRQCFLFPCVTTNNLIPLTILHVCITHETSLIN